MGNYILNFFSSSGSIPEQVYKSLLAIINFYFINLDQKQNEPTLNDVIDDRVLGKNLFILI